MKTQTHTAKSAGKPGLSLEQKVRLLARKFRIAERRRDAREHKRSRLSFFPGIAALTLTLAFLALITFSLATQAATTTPTFEEANTTFASGNYHAAIEQYQAILAQEGYSAPILFNLANACYLNNDLGAAILNYERAQVLAPRDPAIAANLRLARQKAGVPAPAPNEFENAARVMTPNTLAWIGSIGLAAVCLTTAARRFLPRFSPAKAILAVGIATLVLVAAAYAIRWPEFDRAIVITAQAPTRIAPASTATELFALKAGEPVTIVKTYGHFTLVRTPDGRSGWVSEKEIGLIFEAKT